MIIENTDRNQQFGTIDRMFKVKNITLSTHESLHQLVEDFNDVFINKVNGSCADLPTPTTSTYTTEERQLSCSLHEFQTPLNTSVNDIVMLLSSKTSSVHPIPSSEVKHNLDVLSRRTGHERYFKITQFTTTKNHYIAIKTS